METNATADDTAATNDERSRALKERIYASFTGLSILAALAVGGHTTAPEALLSVVVGVVGICSAGFLAEVAAYQVAHRRLPASAELRSMARIALGAFTSASAPILVLAVSWGGLLTVEQALWFGILVYCASLVVIMVVAGRSSGLRPAQQLVSSAMLVGLGVLVVAVLFFAHLH